MSRTIDPDKIASGDLDEDERRYLQDRGLLPAGVDGVSDKLNEAMPLEARANTGDANTEGLSIEQLEAQLAAAKKAQKKLPKIEDEGGIEELEDEDMDLDYDDMNNDERRAELSRRGLIVSGNKEELIARLRRSDSDQLTADDQA